MFVRESLLGVYESNHCDGVRCDENVTRSAILYCRHFDVIGSRSLPTSATSTSPHSSQSEQDPNHDTRKIILVLQDEILTHTPCHINGAWYENVDSIAQRIRHSTAPAPLFATAAPSHAYKIFRQYRYYPQDTFVAFAKWINDCFYNTATTQQFRSKSHLYQRHSQCQVFFSDGLDKKSNPTMDNVIAIHPTKQDRPQ